MIESEHTIVFVVGAGASNEVDMPTGYDLKLAIAQSLAFKVNDFRQLEGGDSKVREAMYQLAQSPGASGDINAYFNSALLIKNAMPLAPSIDNFIDSHRADPKIAECGKLAIASQILNAERASKLYVKDNNIYNKINFKNVEDTWFNAFFQLLTLNTQLENISKRLSRIKIISFNYDRTLEHFLHQAIQNYYGCSSDEAAKALDTLVIMHPYGSVGTLPWQNQSNVAVPYGAELNSEALRLVASTLRTFTEGTSHTPESQIAQIRSSTLDADTLVFLGFAYHELNLELLFGAGAGAGAGAGVGVEGPERHQKRIYGTAKGLSENNKKAIASELVVLGKYHNHQITLRRELSAAEIFPEYARSLRL